MKKVRCAKIFFSLSDWCPASVVIWPSGVGRREVSGRCGDGYKSPLPSPANGPQLPVHRHLVTQEVGSYFLKHEPKSTFDYRVFKDSVACFLYCFLIFHKKSGYFYNFLKCWKLCSLNLSDISGARILYINLESDFLLRINWSASAVAQPILPGLCYIVAKMCCKEFED